MNMTALPPGPVQWLRCPSCGTIAAQDFMQGTANPEACPWCCKPGLAAVTPGEDPRGSS